MSMADTARWLDGMEQLQKNIHEWAKRKGFWERKAFCKTTNGKEEIEVFLPPNIAEKLMLQVSELAEAMEEDRAGKRVLNEIYGEPDGKGGEKPCGFPIELADTVIRIMDLAQFLGIDLGRAILEKVNYNEDREHRHGKQY